MRTALGYVRVSTDEQAERGLGLEAQRQRIRAYCEMKGLHLATIFNDPGLTGGESFGSRCTRPTILLQRFVRQLGVPNLQNGGGANAHWGRQDACAAFTRLLTTTRSLSGPRCRHPIHGLCRGRK
jgi:hypothetical protein